MKNFASISVLAAVSLCSTIASAKGHFQCPKLNSQNYSLDISLDARGPHGIIAILQGNDIGGSGWRIDYKPSAPSITPSKQVVFESEDDEVAPGYRATLDLSTKSVKLLQLKSNRAPINAPDLVIGAGPCTEF